MRVIDHIQGAKKTAFSFEVLPPLKGNDIDKLFRQIDQLIEFDPKYINITSHRSEILFKQNDEGLFRKHVYRKRPGTVAAAAAIKHKYNIDVVPHIVCKGFSKSETEYVLIDLNFLRIHDLLLLRGDDNNKGKYPEMNEESNDYAFDLVQQVNQLNDGKFLDGTMNEPFHTKFSYGVAGYPEKHEEAPNMDSDIKYLKQKVEAGADYIITQMFFDNKKYFSFVDRCREAGITIPIIPGLKPVTVKNHLNILPLIFKSDIPEAFANELHKCKNNDQVKQVGIEWSIQQAKELIQHNVPVIHWYTMLAVKSVKAIAEAIY